MYLHLYLLVESLKLKQKFSTKLFGVEIGIIPYLVWNYVQVATEVPIYLGLDGLLFSIGKEIAD